MIVKKIKQSVLILDSYGTCVAKFSKKGVDFKDMEELRAAGGSLGLYSFSPTLRPSPSDWDVFKLEVKRIFGTSIRDDYRPEWFKS